jgi:RimJ/RimL family protein N-acetyltransferase
MMLQAPRDAVALARAALEADPARGLKGLIGPNAHVVAARDGLGVPPVVLQLDSEDRLYRLDLAALQVPAPLASGALRGRRAEPRDLEALVPWRIDYEISLIHAADSPQMRKEARSALASAIDERRLWVLEEGGKMVSTTGFNTQFEDVVQVGGVYTPPGLRGRGYGRAAVCASLLDARAEGRRSSILFTGLHNVAAQRAYEALGYAPIGSYRLTLLREAWRP